MASPTLAAHGRRGQVIPLVALMLVLLLSAAALAVDVGYLRYQQRLAQTAADSAALAGAAELLYGNSVTTAAKADSASNGFTDNGTTVTVTANHPPASGPYASNVNAVEVIVKIKRSTFFENVFGMNLATIQSRAVALNANRTSECFYALQTGAVNINQSSVSAPTCGIIVNGAFGGNNSTINMLNVGYAGSQSFSQTTFSNGQPQLSIAANDPCPTIAGCRYLSNNAPATSSCTYTNLNKNGGILYPGVYCGGNNFSGSLTLRPGLYVFTSSQNFSNGSLTGTGVTFYVAGGALNIQNVNAKNLAAPTTGNYAGILVYQPPANTNTLNWGTNVGNTVPAVVYAPTASLSINNGALSGIDLIIGGVSSMSNSSFTFPSGGSVPGDTQGVLAE